MKTYQDYLLIPDTDVARADFARAVINEHKASDAYKTAKVGEDYDRQQNTTIKQYQKVLYDLQGRPYNDTISANYQIPSNFFHMFVVQAVLTLLGNGITWDTGAGEALGEDFDKQAVFALYGALVHGCSFGLFNLDHVDVFKLTEFAPIYDEETGALRAGVRFWQLSDDKPLRATLYDENGNVSLLWDNKNDPGQQWTKVKDGCYMKPRQAYKTVVAHTEADGDEILDGENYPTFPIVPLWGNMYKESEIVGMRPAIDAYDIIKSGFANDLDTAQIFWLLHNTGGMDDVDLSQFLDRLKTVHAAVVDDDAGGGVEAHTVEIPVNARTQYLERLRNDLYRDAMALDTETIAANAAVTATQIKAAYERFDSKLTFIEYFVIDFIQGLLAVAGVEDTPTFTRSKILNTIEEIQAVMAAATNLTPDYVTEKVLTLLGDGDRAEEMLAQMDADELERGSVTDDKTDNTENDVPGDEAE